MDRSTLLSMLNLKPTATPAGPVASSPADPIAADASAFNLPEDTALKLDDWDKAQGAKMLGQHPAQTQGLAENDWADLHGVAFKPDPELNEQCINPRRGEFVKSLLSTPEAQALRQSTVLNVLASELASVEFARSFAKLQEKDTQRRKKAEKKGGKVDPTREQAQADAAMLQAVASGLREASKEVEELEDAQAALGMGPGSGSDGKLDATKVASLFQRIKNNPRLRAIFERAGRFRRLAQSKQRAKVRHGYDDMVGTKLDGDPARVLPHELAQLADEDLELDAMRRLVERQSLSRDYQGVDPVGRGPIIVCVDESGSMSGEPIANAKAFALSMAWVARHQNRYCCLIGYAGGTEGTVLVLPPGDRNDAKLVDWLEHFFSGGTTMDVPLAELPFKFWNQIGAPKGKTDLVIITDGIVSVPAKMEKNFNAWKAQEKVRCVTLILANQAGDLARVSDEVHFCRTLDLSEEGIGRCLGV